MGPFRRFRGRRTAQVVALSVAFCAHWLHFTAGHARTGLGAPLIPSESLFDLFLELFENYGTTIFQCAAHPTLDRSPFAVAAAVATLHAGCRRHVPLRRCARPCRNAIRCAQAAVLRCAE